MIDNTFIQKNEFHINKKVREICKFDLSLFSSSGNVIFANIEAIHKFVLTFNTAAGNKLFGKKQQKITAGALNAMGLLDEIFHYVLRLYRKEVEHNFISAGYNFISNELEKKTQNNLNVLLCEFCDEFPPEPVYKNKMSVTEWLNSEDEISRTSNKLIAFEELILLCLANRNPAFKPFSIFFSDINLKKNKSYNNFWKLLTKWSKQNHRFGPNNSDIISMLQEPIRYSPNSLKGQLEYVITNWSKLIQDILLKILGAQDLIREEEKPSWQQPAPDSQNDMRPYNFENLIKEYERFSTDRNWMPDVVLIAKSTLVWLNQLSKKYNAAILRLDQIPDEELRFLSDAGINALWLIGIWQRSEASRTIKQICGNNDAAASAYSIYDYDIAPELGGWEALKNLRARAMHYGIRLAADMVPNHTGLDSKWVMEKPDLFLQRSCSPFPSYSFNGQNLSKDSRTSVYLEDGYYSKTDCAVVFKRQDNLTGDVRYFYHGNDGTGLPWNDTAQIDFLNPNAREEVIQKILHVARNFPIIRFDAAMVLTKKHIRRLWYPEAGHGGDIASRSADAISLSEFEKKIPIEFWREVVDRCTSEIPDTLLLAEAFWMMEGYFVRTLGMHRVYNSAFMNMLKNEENKKYRDTIKNTLEFDGEILKRYVNFMNNPDEETAIAQFGNGDKYFGVCTMMSAMPGLPMFGHGQIEGLTEKYGMEFKYAYKNETPDNALIERHKAEIFPLLKRRRIFSGVENFRLFDFWNNGTVNENVFVWSNFEDNTRSLIFYNNVYDYASGWIKKSAAFAAKLPDGTKHLEQTNLLEALKLTNDENYYTIFHEQRSNLFFIRKNSDIAQSGFFASLNGYETQVFLDIYEVKDDDGIYSHLHKNLKGSGVKNIQYELKKLKFKDFYSVLQNFITSYFENKETLYTDLQLIKNKINCNKLLDSYFSNNETEILNFINHVLSFSNSRFYNAKQPKLQNVKEIYALFKKLAERCLYLIYEYNVLNIDENDKHRQSNFKNYFTTILKTAFNNNEKDFYLLYLFIPILIILNIICGNNIINELELLNFITELICEKIKNFNQANLKKYIIFLLEEIARFTNSDKKTAVPSPNDIFQKILNYEYIREFIDVHEWENELWFNKELAEFFAFSEAFFYFIFLHERALPEALSFSETVYSQIIEILNGSEYKLANLYLNR